MSALASDTSLDHLRVKAVDSYNLARCFETLVHRFQDELLPLLQKNSLELHVAELCTLIRRMPAAQRKYACDAIQAALSDSLGQALTPDTLADSRDVLVLAIKTNPKYLEHTDTSDKFEEFVKELRRDDSRLVHGHLLKIYEASKTQSRLIVIKRTDALLKELADNKTEFTVRGNSIEIPLDQCAEKLAKLIEYYDDYFAAPYNTKGMSADAVREAFDKSGVSVAEMCKLLYRRLKYCTYGEHQEILSLTRDIVQEFDRNARVPLQRLDLDYYEIDKLLITMEKVLVPAAPKNGVRERRRRLPKNPDDIERTLRACIELIVPLRQHITNDKKRDKFDELMQEVNHELMTSQEPILELAVEPDRLTVEEIPALRSYIANPSRQERLDALLKERQDELITGKELIVEVCDLAAEESHGHKLEHLTTAAATILKVGKWIRSVDWEEKDVSSTQKQAILDKLNDLAKLAKGRGPRAVAYKPV